MSFSSIGNFLPKITNAKVLNQAKIALAIEAASEYLKREKPALFARTKIVSLRDNILRCQVLSAPAKEELTRSKEGLYKAIKNVSGISVQKITVEVRGTLAENIEF
jgi:hypothetical protein